VTGRSDNCQSIGDLLGVYALDALEPVEADRVRAHLPDCPRCAHEVDEHPETIGLLAAADGGEAPATVWDAIAATIEGSRGARPEPPPPVLFDRAQTARRRWRWPTTWLAAGAAAAAALTIGAQIVRVNHLDHRVSQLSAAAQQSGGFQGLAAALINT
jgi:anti-sigma factor RsiW